MFHVQTATTSIVVYFLDLTIYANATILKQQWFTDDLLSLIPDQSLVVLQTADTDYFLINNSKSVQHVTD